MNLITCTQTKSFRLLCLFPGIKNQGQVDMQLHWTRFFMGRSSYTKQFFVILGLYIQCCSLVHIIIIFVNVLKVSHRKFFSEASLGRQLRVV